MNYGLPYMGSKNKIAEWVVDILPASDTLYDLFAGGCAVTHCAMLSGKWNNYVINDINPGITQLFIDAIDGKYKDENRWISREDCFRLKDIDPYVSYCWSFSNCNDYLYSKAIEPYKKAYHYAIVFNDWGQYAELYPETVEAAKKALEGVDDRKERRLKFRHFETPQRLESLERLERLNSISSTIKPERLCIDYRDVGITPNSTVYCDIPYVEKAKYAGGFDHDAFYEWALSRPFDVYISEYSMPEGFTCIGEKTRQMSLSPVGGSKKTTEKIFINR